MARFFHNYGQTLTIDHMLLECTVLQKISDEYYTSDSLKTLSKTISEACRVGPDSSIWYECWDIWYNPCDSAVYLWSFTLELVSTFIQYIRSYWFDHGLLATETDMYLFWMECEMTHQTKLGTFCHQVLITVQMACKLWASYSLASFVYI